MPFRLRSKHLGPKLLFGAIRFNCRIACKNGPENLAVEFSLYQKYISQASTSTLHAEQVLLRNDACGEVFEMCRDEILAVRSDSVSEVSNACCFGGCR